MQTIIKKIVDFSRLLRAGLIIGVCFLIIPRYLFSPLELVTYDQRMIMKMKKNPDPGIVIVGLDDYSKKLYSPSERDRRVIAKLVDCLSESGARVIVLDIAFPTAPLHKSKETAVLSESLKKAGNVLIAMPLLSDTEGRSRLEYPEQSVLQNAAGVGSVWIPTDEDNVIRQVDLLMDFENREVPSLSLLVSGMWERLDERSIEHRGLAYIKWGNHTIPLNQRDRMYINFAGPSGTFTRFSLIELINMYDHKDRPENRAILEFFRDKLVLVGSTSMVYQDSYLTPCNRMLSGTYSLPMPGVEVQANIIQTIISGSYIREASPFWNSALLLLLCMLCSLVLSLRSAAGHEFRAWKEIAFIACCIAVFILFVTFVFLRYHIWLDVVRPCMAAIFTYFAFILLRSKKFNSTILNYVPGVHLAISEVSGYSADAYEKDITVVFFDIEGYTEMSSTKSALEVFHTLKEVYGELLTPFSNYGGDIITYLGDAAMITFGAFKPLENHAEKALLSAIEFKKKLTDYNKVRRERNLHPLQVGIGICTGEAAIGILGKSFKEVSVIGTTTNTAARLQGVSKQKGHAIVVNKRAFECLKEKYRFTCYDIVQVKGLGPMVLYGYDEDNQESEP